MKNIYIHSNCSYTKYAFESLIKNNEQYSTSLKVIDSEFYKNLTHRVVINVDLFLFIASFNKRYNLDFVNFADRFFSSEMKILCFDEHCFLHKLDLSNSLVKCLTLSSIKDNNIANLDKVLNAIQSKHIKADKLNIASLSFRELQVFILLSRGSTMRRIAAMLSLSVKTVSSHKIRAFKKLNINTNIT
ncbi:helix-turn-helix transcriptional regulator [Klebsiella oxytoca]|uniref:helix-turn-helix transcriptional regulator n=1 Tax=Klebsiella oxytoca TaxID=571 RepID=UPI001898CB7D|nr:helix-turn-helix transcriptional regulator [Klebsiella oxytoca]